MCLPRVRSLTPSMQASAKKDKMEKDDDERARKVIDQQIARALATKGEVRMFYCTSRFDCLCFIAGR